MGQYTALAEIILKQMNEEKVKKIPSQLHASFEATVIIKAGKQTLEKTKRGNIVITDGWLTDWVTLYDHTPQWTCDSLFTINTAIKERLNQIAQRYYAIVEEYAKLIKEKELTPENNAKRKDLLQQLNSMNYI